MDGWFIVVDDDDDMIECSMLRDLRYSLPLNGFSLLCQFAQNCKLKIVDYANLGLHYLCHLLSQHFIRNPLPSPPRVSNPTTSVQVLLLTEVSRVEIWDL